MSQSSISYTFLIVTAGNSKVAIQGDHHNGNIIIALLRIHSLVRDLPHQDINVLARAFLLLHVVADVVDRLLGRELVQQAVGGDYDELVLFRIVIVSSDLWFGCDEILLHKVAILI